MQWATKPEAWEPIFSVAELDAEDLTDAEDWSIGFLSAVDLAPGAWAPAFDAPETGALLAPISALGGDEAPTEPKARDALSRAALEGVLALYARRSQSV